MSDFNGLFTHPGNIHRLADTRSRSISAENFTGGKGAGGRAEEGTGSACAQGLGRGWKVSPSVMIEPGQEFTMADIEGPGSIQHIWMCPVASGSARRRVTGPHRTRGGSAGQRRCPRRRGWCC